jgi:peptidoglycan-N-acetylglucosamine deacetylase
MAAALFVGAAAGFAAHRGHAGRTTTTIASAAPTTTAVAETAAPPPTTAPAAPRAPERPGGAPTPAEQQAAVAAVRAVGVPLYRTPGRAGKVVALTFDDGPGPYSRTTVETLRHYGMRGTFFLCGTSVERYPDDPAVETTVAALGDHTWDHPALPDLSPAAVRSEIARTQTLVQERSGARVGLFRSPYGARTPAIDAVANRLGMIQVLWSVESGDSAGAGWREMLARIEATLAPGDIVLFHENRGQTQKVINRLVPWMRSHGWRSVSVPEMLAMDPPSAGFLREQAGRFA